MVKRIVDTNFWISRQVIDNYSVEDKFFALYLMTNDMTSQVGIYSLPKKIMSFETGFTTDVIQVLLDRFSEKYGEIVYSEQTQEVALLNSLSYSILTGGAPVEKLLQRELREVEDGTLILKTYYAMLDFWNGSVRKFDKEVKSIFEKELTARELINLDNQNQNENEKHNDSHNDIHNDNDNHNHNDNDKTQSDSFMTQRANQDMTHRVNQNMTHMTVVSDEEMNQEEKIAIEQYIKYLEHKNPAFDQVIEIDNILSIFYKEVLGEVTVEVQGKFRDWEDKLPKSIILEALVRSEDKVKPISYAGRIIDNWLKKGVENTQDIARLDREYNRENT